MTLTQCLCEQSATINGLPMIRCGCGVLRQDVRMTGEEYAAWYGERYFDGVYTHTYEHDREIARKRLAAYRLPAGTKLLDVGAGNGGFVEEAVASGLDAWGQDLAVQSEGPRIYVGPLPEIRFPTWSFDVVTMHDVLEHVPEPRRLLREIRRVLVPGGSLIVDFPRFHEPQGRHHWKPVEHLWMLSDDQVTGLLETEGFAVKRVEHPIPSKSVFHARQRPVPAAARILVPPGIGDGYWVLAKLRGFLDARGIEMPEVWVHDAAPRRSGEFWERVPFVRFAGYAPIPVPRAKRKRPVPEHPNGAALRRAYREPGFAVQKDVCGFDYMLSLNGSLDAGRTLDAAIPGPLDWYEPIFHSKEDEAHRERFRADYGDYVVAAFWDKGFYRTWLADFGEDRILETLRLLANVGKTVIICGADWDRGRIGGRLASADPRFVDLIGDTSFSALLGMISGASGVLGFPAGNLFLGPYLRRPTVLLWSDHFPRSMWTGCVPADGYTALHTRNLRPSQAAGTLLEAMVSTRTQVAA